jgi:tetratricopeptide (TPR) repeat protein
MSVAREGAVAGRPAPATASLQEVMTTHRSGDLAAAEAGYRAILDRDPDQPDAHHLLGVCLLQRRAGREAFDHVNRAIALRPDVAEFHSTLGRILRKAGKPQAALPSFTRALRLSPGYGEAENELALALCDMKRYAEAESILRNAVARNPKDADLHTTLGRLHLLTADLPSAVAAFHAALTIAPNQVNAFNNLGVAFNLLGDPASARLALERALALDPDHIDAHTNYGQILLQQGAFAEGWRHHEWRLRRPDYRRKFAAPMWQGEPLDGRSILIWCEQGLGDAIHFIRYAPLVAARGGRVLVECRPPLHRLIAGVEGVAAVFDSGKAEDYAVHVPVMSLPHVFATTPASIPAAVPYVPSQAPLPTDGGGARLKVGLAWAGNPDYLRDRSRSRRLCEFAPLAALRDVAFYGLQVGPASGETPPPGMALTDLVADVKDFYDTTARLAAIDLLITVDSACAHLAGAMGRPVWVLLDAVADWRWRSAGDDTPWYPTMRLFRCAGEWPDLFARVAEALKRFERGR